MKTIIVDHDLPTEISGHIRFNRIIPILRAWGAEQLHTPWADQTLDNGIITPGELPLYIDSDYNIIYAVTTRMPPPDARDQGAWLGELGTEIPENIIELANDGKLHIAFFIGEIITLSPEQILGEVNNQLYFAGIVPQAITVYIPNFSLDVLNAPHIKFISIFEASYYYDLSNSSPLPLKANIIQTVNLEERSKKFTCLNHLNKGHRLAFAASLFKAGKHTDGYFSYHLNPLLRSQPDKFIMTVNANDFLGNCPFLIDTTVGAYETINAHCAVLKPLFNDAYWNFVTESFFAEYSTLTEKTFKPIVNLQPFLIIGAPHSLTALKDLGYETFSSVINESYDYIEDHDRRMEILVETALSLIGMTHKQHIRIMTKIKPILEHNQRHFFSKHWKDFL